MYIYHDTCTRQKSETPIHIVNTHQTRTQQATRAVNYIVTPAMFSTIVAVVSGLAYAGGGPKLMHTWGALQTDISVLRPGAIVQYQLASDFHSIDPSDFNVINVPALVNVTITTTQSSALVIDAFHRDQFFNVDGHLSLSDVVLQHGGTEVGGAIAITANASVQLTNVAFVNNSAWEGGGALFVDGQAACSRCSFTGNSARDGGAVYTRGHTTFSHCTFEDNKATHNGGGLTLTLTLTQYTQGGGAVAVLP